MCRYDSITDLTYTQHVYFCFLFYRRLNHPNIVEFYGMSLLRNKGTVRMILVMEKCKGDLRSHIFESAPGKSEDPNVVRMTCRWVQEITDALAYIHEQGIVHRDLKLDNILVRSICLSILKLALKYHFFSNVRRPPTRNFL